MGITMNTPNWAQIIQAFAATFAAIGTVSAVVVSLRFAWHNREQFRITTRLNVLPTLIRDAEDTASSLEGSGLILPRDVPNFAWQPPKELRALKETFEELKRMRVTDDTRELKFVTKQTAFETHYAIEKAHNRIRTHALLISAVEALIHLREEFQKLAEKTRPKTLP